MTVRSLPSAPTILPVQELCLGSRLRVRFFGCTVAVTEATVDWAILTRMG